MSNLATPSSPLNAKSTRDSDASCSKALCLLRWSSWKYPSDGSGAVLRPIPATIVPISGLRLNVPAKASATGGTVRFLPLCGMIWWFAMLFIAGQGPRTSPEPGGAQFSKSMVAYARPLRDRNAKPMVRNICRKDVKNLDEERSEEKKNMSDCRSGVAMNVINVILIHGTRAGFLSLESTPSQLLSDPNSWLANSPLMGAETLKWSPDCLCLLHLNPKYRFGQSCRPNTKIEASLMRGWLSMIAWEFHFS